MKTLLTTIVVLGLALILLAVRVILKKNGRFSHQHISQSKAMRDRGIHCATSQDREQRATNSRKLNVKNL